MIAATSTLTRHCAICEYPTARDAAGHCLQCAFWTRMHVRFPLPTRAAIIESFDETEYVPPVLEAEYPR